MSPRWLNSNFRLELGSLPTSRIASVSALSLQREVSYSYLDGGHYRMADSVGPFQISDLLVTGSALDADPWRDWYHSFVIDGHADPNEELNGSIIPQPAAATSRPRNGQAHAADHRNRSRGHHLDHGSLRCQERL